ncbi:chemotaxis-specific protein-glutamate methyltransferase CheB [Coprothermobacter platensis]|uniref:chemotaxis-specific protein-glutamate methyltransferase CheB n=1 Tax=Coprothermobacter platensis TaxID=108819 RepID=UPI00036547A5|nr:chemotaxis-specific protein-glutamate methyltransferase CheB [Coprothermobacter platensis]
MARVLIVEDSRFVRQLVCDILKKNLNVICDEASTVKEAISKIKFYPYDVILLDYILPDGTGMDILHEAKSSIQGKVILFSSLAEEGADITVQALSEGAADFILKPGWGGMLAEQFSAELLSKVGTFLEEHESSNAVKELKQPQVKTDRTVTSTPLTAKPFVKCGGIANGIIVVGSSTGGPQALRRFLAKFECINVPMVIAQHMPPVFTKSLAEQLNRTCHMTVIEAVESTQLQPNKVYIVTGGKHGIVSDNQLDIIDGPPVNGVKPAADLLFASAGESYKSQTLGVVLTGMGKDGLEGSKIIKQMGGKVIAESENTAVVWGMPGEIAKNGLADAVEDLELLPEVVERIISTWK